MNVSEFNNVLKKKIRAAKKYEELNDKEKAIKTWITVSELTLRQSKNPELDLTYRNYLIQKTRQIIEYVKKLKSGTLGGTQNTALRNQTSKTSTLKTAERRKSEVASRDQALSSDKKQATPVGDKTDTKTSSDETRQKAKNQTTKKGISREHSKAIDDLESEFKNMPQGFRTLNPSKEFQPSDIKTPLDEEKIKERENQEIDMSIFQQNKEQQEEEQEKKETLGSNSKSSQQKSLKGPICFACGTQLEEGQPVCHNCGTDQKTK
ncbi:MAG: hypothetical protein ACOC4M_10765 [Promethearchaeia archaeon]